jgi:hypothetical protein
VAAPRISSRTSPQTPVTPRQRRTLLLAACLAGYPVAAFRPFRFEWPLAWNRARRVDDASVAFEAPGILRSREPPAWVGAVRRGAPLEVLLDVTPASAGQRGPARILSLSEDPLRRNLTVAQDRDALVVRLRTTASTPNGTPEVRVPGVFAGARPVAIALRVGPAAPPAAESLAIDVDGVRRAGRALPAGSLATWDPGYRLALGNELTCDRPWLGVIRRALVRAGGREASYTAPGALEAPRLLVHVHHGPNLVPFRGTTPGDALLNVLGFVPLGLLVGGGGRRTFARSLALVLVASAAIETVQLLLPQRYPSVTDLLLNGAGGALGILLARRTRWLAAAPDGR